MKYTSAGKVRREEGRARASQMKYTSGGKVRREERARRRGWGRGEGDWRGKDGSREKEVDGGGKGGAHFGVGPAYCTGKTPRGKRLPFLEPRASI
jgi:hypothetical protein